MKRDYWNFVSMVKNCCVVGCHNVFKKNSGIQFYRFPTNPEKQSKWIAAVKRMTGYRMITLGFVARIL